MPQFCQVAFPVRSRRVFTYRTGNFSSRVFPGQRVKAPFASRELTGFVTELSESHQLPPGTRIREISGLVDREPLLDRELVALADWIARYYGTSLGEALETVLSASLTPPRRPPAEKEFFFQPSLPGISGQPLNPDQQSVVEEIARRVESAPEKPVLLQGVTASGKTDIYLHLAARAGEKGLQTLLLVPEIALTIQAEAWAADYLENRVAVLHSRLPPKRHYALLEKARRGEITLVIGTRSAIFTPLRKTGLIIVDEEFDSSYKEIKSPRYHARDVALKRGELEKALVVLGSATPSMETWHRARSGFYHLLNLEKRVGRPEKPAIRILDRRYRHGCGRRRENSLVPEQLRSMIEERLLRREQVLILVNRRGSTTRVLCRKCGKVLECPDCRVSLVFRRSTGELNCHLCGRGSENPDKCPACRSGGLERRSSGAAAVLKELEKIFPDVPVLHAESATLAGEKGAALLGDFRDGRYPIMVGTRLLAKGHHFPGVTLAAVLGGDYLLEMPDFRAAEKTFQTLVQFAGRAGRCLPGAEMVIQTHHPENYAIAAVADDEPGLFYEKELAFRSAAGYPPCGHLLNILFTARKEKTARDNAGQWTGRLSVEAEKTGVEILGPAPCFRKKMRGLYRWHAMLKAENAEKITALIARFPELSSRRNIAIDMDPCETA